MLIQQLAVRLRNELGEVGFVFALAVSFAGMPDGDDLDGVFLLRLEEDAVIAAAKAEVRVRRLEFLYVAGLPDSGQAFGFAHC